MPDVQPPLSGSLDTPPNGALLQRGVVQFAGWAFDEAAPIDRVEIVLGDRPPARMRLGLVREDVRERWDIPHARLAGFEAMLDLAELPSAVDQLRVGVVASTMYGQRFVIAERTYTVAAAELGDEPEGRRRARQHQLRERTKELLGRPVVGETRTPGELDLVVFAHDLGLGGAQLWLSELLRCAGAGRDFPCTVIAPQPGPLLEPLEALGIDVHVTNGYPVEDLETYEGSVAELAALSRRAGHTAVLVNTFCSFIGVDVAQRLQLPCAWAIHESYRPALLWSALYPPGHVDPLIRATAIRALGHASALLFVAESTRRLFLDATDPERAITIPYGVDTAAIELERARASASGDARACARASLGLPPNATILLLVGAPEPRKAHMTTAEAFARLTGDFPDAMLVLLGASRGPYADALRSYVADAGLIERCLVLPVLADTSVWYLSADVLICASDVESLPRVVLEAMCFGVPVLATNVFGLRDVIMDATTGWLFEPRSVGDAEAALRRVLGLSAETRGVVGAKGRAFVHDRHDSTGYSAAISRLLRGLAADPEAKPRDLVRADVADRAAPDGEPGP
jgi:glycosyltransferase involved in cell wall biosynthesis